MQRRGKATMLHRVFRTWTLAFSAMVVIAPALATFSPEARASDQLRSGRFHILLTVRGNRVVGQWAGHRPPLTTNGCVKDRQVRYEASRILRRIETAGASVSEANANAVVCDPTKLARLISVTTSRVAVHRTAPFISRNARRRCSSIKLRSSYGVSGLRMYTHMLVHYCFKRTRVTALSADVWGETDNGPMSWFCPLEGARSYRSGNPITGVTRWRAGQGWLSYSFNGPSITAKPLPKMQAYWPA